MASNQIRDQYVGERRNHLRDGYGVYKYENKFYKYEGQWKAGKMHGHGKLVMKDGSFYEGEFKDGEITGHGFKYFARTRNTFSGEFYLGEIEGNGVMRYSDGSVYEGHWKHNQRDGKGRLTEADGSLYEGEFYKNRRHGDGKNIYSDGSEYEGGYINGKRHGQGVFKMIDGSVFDGQWINDVFNGEGVMLHASGFVYSGLWVNGKPAQRATKMQFTEIDSSKGITITQGEPFSIDVQTVDDDGEIVKDDGRELKVTAGYKYVPRPPSKDSNLFEAIEDVEENLIQTPMGYTVLPYPLTDQPVHMTAQDTDLSTLSRTDTNLEQEESTGENAQASSTEKSSEEKDIQSATPRNSDSEDILTHQAPQNQKVSEGCCLFSSLMLLPPPPLYRPFQQLSEKSGTDLKAKAAAKKPAAAKTAGSGTYVLIITDVTNPPFLGESLPPLYTTITIKKKKREPTIVKERGPKWDTNKHIAATVAMHREDTMKMDSAVLHDD
ncbi:MORN repeat-containing protein 1-like isoform X2 [Watersipora subatra]|uniref:MORN repeat-containing protein 1-like isoform X2 n=1 Tax=Watersipora subatra TaxID=2589382 RepID=UPI00355BE83D